MIIIKDGNNSAEWCYMALMQVIVNSYTLINSMLPDIVSVAWHMMLLNSLSWLYIEYTRYNLHWVILGTKNPFPVAPIALFIWEDDMYISSRGWVSWVDTTRGFKRLVVSFSLLLVVGVELAACLACIDYCWSGCSGSCSTSICAEVYADFLLQIIF
jgi:hypothetical protein